MEGGRAWAEGLTPQLKLLRQVSREPQPQSLCWSGLLLHKNFILTESCLHWDLLWNFGHANTQRHYLNDPI